MLTPEMAAGATAPVKIADDYPLYNLPTCLQADERVGQLMVTAVLLATTKGREVLQDRFALDFDEKRVERRSRFRSEDDFGSKEEDEQEDEQGEVSGDGTEEEYDRDGWTVEQYL